MSIILDDVSCLLHLPIRRKLIDHTRISKDEALKLMVDYLGVNPEYALREIENPEGLMLGSNS